MNILQAIDDSNLFQPWFKDPETWRAWRVFLSALFGLAFEDGEAEIIFEECTRRIALPPAERPKISEAWLIVGRRGGKSRTMALIAAFLAAFFDYRPFLSPGERAVVLLIAADKRQARVLLRYIRAFFANIPMLAKMVERDTAEGIDLNTDVSIEIGVTSFRSTRGFTCAAILCDEIAFWMSDETSANPDTEILSALAPSMATIPNSLLIAASSPYSKRGALYDAYKRYWNKKPDSTLIWRASTRVMNSNVKQSIIDAALEKDPAKARSEWLAEFRDDIVAFVAREIVESCVDPNEIERPYNSALRYFAFVDPSGGSSDSFTLAIGHKSKDSVIVDVVREIRAPFDPETTTEEFCKLLKRYGISKATGDRYAGEWPREQFRKRGITYVPSQQPKSGLYTDLLPRLNSRTIRLVDNARLVNQIAGLERRTARGGRDSIDHAPGAQDDLANVVAGVAVHANVYHFTSIEPFPRI